MRVFAYLRVSTDKQAESGAGIAAQETACRQWAERSGMVIERTFIEDGISGTAPLEKRPALLQAISFLGKGDLILVAKRDRMGRDIRNLVKIEDEVLSKGARIISAAGEGTEGDAANDIFMRGIFDLVSQHERNMISDRTRAAMQAKKARGERVGYIPFGYRLSEDEIHIEKDEAEQSVLSQIRDLMTEGLSTRKIAAEMNRRGAFNRGGAKWNHASIHRVMTKIAA